METKGELLLQAIDKLTEDSLDTLDLDDMDELNDFMVPFQYHGNGDAGIRLVKRLMDQRPPLVKEGDYFTEDGELRIVTKATWEHWYDSDKQKLQLGVWIRCANVKKDGSAYENGKSHTEIKQLASRGFFPTDIADWEYSKDDRSWVKKSGNESNTETV